MKPFFLCFLLWATIVSGQQIPMFETPFYFEDAVGNKDTLIIGYDTLASHSFPNTQFGEIVNDTPFDSVFDVRAMHGDDGLERMVEKIIGGHEISSVIGEPPSICGATSFINIFVNAKYLPIKISYDSTLFDPDGCNANAVLSINWDVFTLQDWWDSKNYHCLGESNEILEDFSQEFDCCGSFLSIEKQVEGQGLKTIPGIFWVSFYYGPCGMNIPVVEPQEKQVVDIVPNPASVYIDISYNALSIGDEIVIRDALGRVLLQEKNSTGQTFRVNTEHWEKGLYFVSSRTAKHGLGVVKFIKQ